MTVVEAAGYTSSMKLALVHSDASLRPVPSVTQEYIFLVLYCNNKKVVLSKLQSACDFAPLHFSDPTQSVSVYVLSV